MSVLVLSGVYQPLIFAIGGQYPLVFLPYTVACAAIAAALLALAFPGRLALPALAAVVWTLWFTDTSVLRVCTLHDLPRLFSVLLLASLPMWALRKEVVPTQIRHAYIPTLDGWRAVAILLVIADHAMVPISWRLPEVNRYRFGQHGVNLFFALSGFLITTRLLDEKLQTGTISLRSFYRRRVFRILPAVLFPLGLIGILACAGLLKVRAVELASALFYFRNLVLHSPSSVTGHFWSLSIEEQFYLLVPLLVLLFCRRRMVAACVAVACASAAWRWFYFSRHSYDSVEFMVTLRTDFRLDGLLFGCVLAYALHNPVWVSRIKRLLVTPVWVALVAAMGVLVWRFPYINTLRESLLWPLLLAGTVLRPNAVVGRILEWKPLRTIGVLSYSLYVWQQLFLMSQPAPQLEWITRLPVNLVLAFAFGGASYWLVERPVQRWARRSPAEPHRTPAAVAVPVSSLPVPVWGRASQVVLR